VPVHANAALRGVWTPITDGGPFNIGLANGCEQPAFRPGHTITNEASLAEYWFSFTTRSTIVGSETVRSIWQCRNTFRVGGTVTNMLDARRPLKIDPAGIVSYLDPAWSPDGKYLAYIETDGFLTQSAIYIQEFMVSSGSVLSTAANTASTPVGAPLLVVPATPGVLTRSPDWKPDGTALCYASSASGLSLDIWYVAVDPATSFVGVPARATTLDNKAEQNPTWGPGNRIAYATNKFGPNIIEIIDLDDMSTTLADLNFAAVSHNNPSFSSDGNSIYYDAPQDENINNPSDIWKLDIPTQSKCDIFLDNRGDADPDASAILNTTPDGVPYNLFVMSTVAALQGSLGIMRGNASNCGPPVPIGVALSPTTLNLGSQGNNLTVTITMTPEAEAQGFYAACDLSETNQLIPAGKEGIKNRNTVINSPTFLGLASANSPTFGAGVGTMFNKGGQVDVLYDRRRIGTRLVALGLVDQLVLCPVTAYSNNRGRQYQGFGYLTVTTPNLAGQIVRMEQNSPNPFNPRTKISFAVAKAGFVNVRVYNVRGELVKTVASGQYGPGSHEASWDGTNQAGTKTGSGVYFAKASIDNGNGGEVTTDTIKMVMAK